MRPFIHLYFALLLPISLLIAVMFIVYFTLEYSLTQSITLGVLYGLFTGIFVTFIAVIAIILLRKNQNHFMTKRKIAKKENTVGDEKEELKQESSPMQDTHENVQKGMTQKRMLLINKELTFELILTMIKKQMPRSITTHNIHKGSIDIKIYEELISISVTSLTKHTSQVIANGVRNSQQIEKIISFLKEKEHFFLQY